MPEVQEPHAPEVYRLRQRLLFSRTLLRELRRWCDQVPCLRQEQLTALLKRPPMATFKTIVPGDLLIERHRTRGERVCIVIARTSNSLRFLEVSPARGISIEESPSSDVAKFEHVAIKELLAAQAE